MSHFLPVLGGGGLELVLVVAMSNQQVSSLVFSCSMCARVGLTHVKKTKIKDTYLSHVCNHEAGQHGDTVNNERAALCEMFDPGVLRGETECQMACYCATPSEGERLNVCAGN